MRKLRVAMLSRNRDSELDILPIVSLNRMLCTIVPDRNAMCNRILVECVGYI